MRKLVSTPKNMVIRRATVNRNRTPQKMLDATRRVKYLDNDVVAAMPRGEGESVRIFFFLVGRSISDDELEKEYRLRNLIPVDPYSLAAINENDRSFATKYQNATHWKDRYGRWCRIVFRRWDGEQRVSVGHLTGKYSELAWFAGFPCE
ncbi:MAG: hypothetical protein ACYCZZ_00515 [Minisyncoccota bacterium]